MRPLISLQSIAAQARAAQSRLVVRPGSEALAKLAAKSATAR